MEAYQAQRQKDGRNTQNQIKTNIPRISRGIFAHYELTIVGIYEGAKSFNQILMSEPAPNAILEASEAVSVEITDEDSGRTYESAVSGALEATYVFENTEA